MKNETARREIESLDYYLQNHTNDYSEKSHTAMMMAIEALQAEPKHGHWIERTKCEYRCDQCGKIVFADDENELNYCCCCGAKMSRYEW